MNFKFVAFFFMASLSASQASYADSSNDTLVRGLNQVYGRNSGRDLRPCEGNSATGVGPVEFRKCRDVVVGPGNPKASSNRRSDTQGHDQDSRPQQAERAQ